MKIPDKDDPGGDKEGAVARDVVLAVLKDNDVQIKCLGDDLYLMSNTAEEEAQVFRSVIGGLMVRRLAKIFTIDLIEFYYDPLNAGKKRSSMH